MRDKIMELRNLAVRGHCYCEDGWYSCPLAEDGCADDSVPEGVCNCGADDHNAKVDNLVRELLRGLSK